MTRRAQIRRVVAQLHLWLGLTIGLLWALQGATGALLAFHRDLDRGFGVQGSAGAPASLDQVVAAAGGVDQLRLVTIRDGNGDVLIADRTDKGTLLIDASTAEVLGERSSEPTAPGPNGATWRWLYKLHDALLLGDRGETLIGISGLFLLSAALAGLWLGWPRGGGWRIVFDPRRWKSSGQRLHGWHRAAGLLAALGLICMTVSGAWMIFASDLRPWLARNAGFQLPAKPPAAGPVLIAPQAAVDTAHAQFPGSRFVRLTMPTAKAGAYVVRMRQTGEARAWSGVTSVTIDSGTGQVVARYDPLTAPLPNRLADAAFALHTGELAGLPGRILVLAVGLSLPMFYVTGSVAWYRRKRRKSANKMKRAQPT